MRLGRVARTKDCFLPLIQNNAEAEWIDEEVVVDGNWVSSRKPDDIRSNWPEAHGASRSTQRATGGNDYRKEGRMQIGGEFGRPKRSPK